MGKSLDFPGKTEFVDTIRAQEKCCKKWHKKENVHQDISDTLKSRLLKNTNIRGLVLEIANAIHHIGRVPGQIGRTPGQVAAVSFIFLAPKSIQRF